VRRPFALRKKAQKDIKKIWEWAADQYGEPRADRLVGAIYDDCLMLANMPGIGHKRPDLSRRNSLFWTIGDYYLIYTPDTSPLEIDRVIHTSRDVRRQLS
jgi:plasmid stabilization system protein ParE